MTQFTERQAAAWPEAISRLHARGAALSDSLTSWTIHYADEVRPGRGHFVNAIYIDGEIFAQIMMDVYGHPIVSFATLDWVHADSNEECECDLCCTERESELA